MSGPKAAGSRVSVPDASFYLGEMEGWCQDRDRIRGCRAEVLHREEQRVPRNEQTE